jgi:N-methylhydantoinase A/oxoprolinase/acetone carboxylase beta subunit
MADLLHVYSKYSEIKLFDGKIYLSDYNEFNAIVREMRQNAQRDIKSEGYSIDDARYYLEITLADDNSQNFRVTTEKLELTSEADVKILCAKFLQVRERLLGKNQYKGKTRLLTTMLNASITMPHWQFKAIELGSPDPQRAFKSEREVFWSPEKGYQKTPIYDRDLLQPGNFIKGPAIIEAKDTTYAIPANWNLNIDKYSNAILEEV